MILRAGNDIDDAGATHLGGALQVSGHVTKVSRDVRAPQVNRVLTSLGVHGGLDHVLVTCFAAA